LERDPTILAREQLAVEGERLQLGAKRQTEERQHAQQMAQWAQGLAAAQVESARTQLDIAMQRRRPAQEILALEQQSRQAAEAEMARRMDLAILEQRTNADSKAVETERTRQAAERARLDQEAYQRRIELRQRDLGSAAGLAGAQQGYAEARMGHAQAFGRPAGELLAWQDQIDARRHAAQRITLQQAAREVKSRQDIYALAKARLQIAGQELQAAQQRRQIEVQGAQHQVNLAATAAGLAGQRYQQTMTLFNDPRLRMLSGVGIADVQRMQDAAYAAKERQYEQTLQQARLQGPVAEREAQAQIAMQREQDRFQRMMEGQELRRSLWQRGFTSAGGTPLAMGTGEAGFASALIGGDQGRISDILQAAHRQSLKPLQLLNDGLTGLRKPDTSGLREGVLGALRERDKAFLEEIVAAVRGAAA
jgi:hypothetical protein